MAVPSQNEDGNPVQQPHMAPTCVDLTRPDTSWEGHRQGQGTELGESLGTGHCSSAVFQAVA